MAGLDRPQLELRALVDLVNQVRAGHLRIPVFQRGFVWNASQVVELFDSVAKGYPIGNLLVWRGPAPQDRCALAR